MKKLPTIFSLSLALAGVPALPSFAQIQHISEDAAVSATSRIKLQVGRGINLKLPTGTKVYKGWIDDRSIAQVDGDRPFEQGAAIVHLLASKTGTTNLSMIVSDGDAESLYVFELVAQTKPVAPVVAVIGSSAINPSQLNTSPLPALVNASYTSAQSVQSSGVEIFKVGVDNAIRQGLLAPNGELHQAINKFISHYGSGKSVEAATRKAKLQPAVIEQLFELGRRLAPKPTVTPAQELLVEAVPQSEVEAPRKPKKVRIAKTPKPDSTYQAIVERLEKLETKVDGIEEEVQSLDEQQDVFVVKLERFNQQQDKFVARLENLDSKQAEFLAKLNGSNRVVKSKQRPITLTLQVPELPAPESLATVSNLRPVVGGPIVDEPVVENPEYSPSQIATALRYGLTAAHHKGQIRNGTKMHYMVNSWIRRVLYDHASVPHAASISGIPEKTAKQVLQWGKIDPGHVGY